MSYQNFEFTAIAEDDLLTSSASRQIAVGDTFTMPGQASVCIEVSDNDIFLSGDNVKNDNANDGTGQHASITANGVEQGNGGQIYAESLFWVHDQYGNCYQMVEIEQEGVDKSDYFTFYNGGGFGTPPAGAQLTVYSCENVKTNFLDYKCFDGGPKVETGTLVGTVWCDDNCDGLQTGDTSVTKGENILKDGDFEAGSTDYNAGGYGAWYEIGSSGDIVQGTDQGHLGNGAQNELWELDKGSILCQIFDVAEAGTYCLTLDVYDSSKTSSDGFEIKINGETVEVVNVNSDGTVEVELDLAAGENRIDFVSTSTKSGKGAGIDNIELRQVIEDTPFEATKEGVEVKLIDASTGTVVATTLTDANGDYEFGGLAAGDYELIFVAPDGTEFTIEDVDGNSQKALDSDVNAEGSTGVFHLGAGETIDRDAGLKPAQPGTLVGTVWCDDNCDGLQTGDTSVTKGENILKDGGFEADSTQYNVDGFGAWYEIGSYGDIVQGTDQGHLGNGAQNEIWELDKGSTLCQIFDVAEAGTYCLTLDVYDSSKTSSDGFKIKINGETVEVVNVNSDGTVEVELDLAAGENRIDFVSTSTKSGKGAGIDNIELRQLIEEAPFEATKEGVEVKLIDASTGKVVATTLTDANGDYGFGGLAAGDYELIFVAPDGTEFTIEDVDGNSQNDLDSDVDATGSTGVFSLGSGETIDRDAGLKPAQTGALEGRYFCDENGDNVDNGEPGVEGATVLLFDGDADQGGTLVASTTTDADGNYRFDDVPAGDNYVVYFQDPDTVAGSEGKVFVDPNVGDDANDSDVTGTDASGRGETGPVSVVAGETTSDVDAGIVDPGTAEISGRYFCDENDNDVDDGEPGIANATVTLLDASGAPIRSTTTDADGNYSFTGLTAGTYAVSFAETADKAFVAQDQGGDDTVDSDVDPNSGTTGPITVGIGESSEDNDAGVEVVDPGTAEISGRYFCDENDNDVDDGEPGIANATVTLLDASGAPIRSTTTDADGNYSFTGLTAGTYAVSFAETADKAFVAQDQGGDDTVDSDVDPNTGTTGPITVGIGESSEDNDAGVEVIDPGTAAIGDKVFFDTNGNGQQDAGEIGASNVNVTLIDLNGGPSQSTTTDANGMYLFDNLDAGDYQVVFEELDGFDFTTANQGDDTTDSDADETTGATGTISLEIGEQDLTVDAGLVAENGVPTPADDMGKGCADEDITVDVLANDSDPDGDSLTVTAVNGAAIAEGETITVDGVKITLNGSELVFDGETAFVGLDIGEEATVNYTYTVSDGTDTADATAAVTFCGDANSVQSLYDSLPANGSYQVVDGRESDPFSEGGYDITVSGTGDARFDGVTFEYAYCLDFRDDVLTSGDFGSAPVLTGDISGGNTTDALEPSAVSSANGLTAEENMDLVQYIVAQNYEANGEANGWEVQFAIWELTNNFDSDAAFDFNADFGDLAVTDGIIADALANGEGFTPGETDTVSFIIDPNPATNENEQPYILAFDFEAYDCLC